MGKKLFVGNLSFDTTDESMKTAFSPFGNVVSSKVIRDRETKKSRGFGFVEFEDANTADEAMGVMNEAEVDGRNIRVDMAQEKQSSRGGGSGRDAPRDAPRDDRPGFKKGGKGRGDRDRGNRRGSRDDRW